MLNYLIPQNHTRGHYVITVVAQIECAE